MANVKRLHNSIGSLQQSLKTLHATYGKESLQLLKDELFEKVVKTHFVGGNFQFFASSTTVSSRGSSTTSTSSPHSSASVSVQDTQSSVDVLYALHEQYYWPTFCFIHEHFLHFRQTQHNHKSIPSSSGATSETTIACYPPFLVGVSAPQGCGKTTMTEMMTKFFKFQKGNDENHPSINCIAMSLDDFYLKGEDQEQLATTYSSNPLLQYRGNGTYQIFNFPVHLFYN